jgi:hypothetical protein
MDKYFEQQGNTPTWDIINQWLKTNPIITRNKAEKVDAYIMAHPNCMFIEDYYRLIEIPHERKAPFCIFCHHPKSSQPWEVTCGQCNVYKYLKNVVYKHRLTSRDIEEIDEWTKCLSEVVQANDSRPEKYIYVGKKQNTYAVSYTDYKKTPYLDKQFPGFFMTDGSWSFYPGLPAFNDQGLCLYEPWEGEYSIAIDEYERAGSDVEPV